MVKKTKRIQVPGKNFKPHPTQMEFLASDAETKILMAGRRWGKTRAAVAQTLMWVQEASLTPAIDEYGNDMTATLRPEIHVWVVGPNYLQLKQVMEEFLFFIPKHQILDRSDSAIRGTRQYELRLRLKNEDGRRGRNVVRQNALIEFKSADNYEALQTVGLDVLYITESQDVKDEAMDKVMPTLTTPYRQRRALFEGIPPDSESHWFARHWNKANYDQDPRTEAFRYFTTDNYHIGAKGFRQVLSHRDRMTEEAWQRMYFAKQPGGSGAFFNRIYEAAVLDEEQFKGPELGQTYVAGLDIGRRNSESVIVVKNGRTRESVYGEALGDSDWDWQLQRFQEICRDWRVSLLHFDGTSCGGDIMEYLLTKSNLPAIPFIFSSKSKLELYTKYAIALEQGLVSFPKQWDMLVRQLQAVRNKGTKVAKFESDGGILDDWVDAECLALWVCESDPLDISTPHDSFEAPKAVLDTHFLNEDYEGASEYANEQFAIRIHDMLMQPSREMLAEAERQYKYGMSL